MEWLQCRYLTDEWGSQFSKSLCTTWKRLRHKCCVGRHVSRKVIKAITCLRKTRGWYGELVIRFRGFERQPFVRWNLWKVIQDLLWQRDHARNGSWSSRIRRFSGKSVLKNSLLTVDPRQVCLFLYCPAVWPSVCLPACLSVCLSVHA